jgi:hypothetical protein
MKTTYNSFLVLNETRVKSNEKIDIYRDEKYVVVEVLTHKASCKYGAFTQWCISHPFDPTAWNAGVDVEHVIFIINKSFKPNFDKIKELDNLNDKFLNDELNEKEKEKYFKLIKNKKAQDLSKIAIIVGYYNTEIWDANNINLTYVYPYGYKDLPIDQKVIDAIDNYINEKR